MTALYSFLGITRQAAFQAWERQRKQAVLADTLTKLVHDIRMDHPQIGLRKMYTMLEPLPIGRDKFELLMRDHGLSVHHVRRPWVTTHAQHVIYHPNLLSGLTINGIHQAWVTDLTYFRILDRFVYLVFILDVYTRLILAAIASRSMHAEANIKALDGAILRAGDEREARQTIHHSDFGSQYIDAEYCRILKEHDFILSMCEHAYENPYVERVQGTIKNEYLYPRGITRFEELTRELARAVMLYNTKRPHRSHPRMMTPASFAEHVLNLDEKDRPTMTIYDSSNDPVRSKRRVLTT
jgi:transposase InsO family protein